MRRKLVVAIAVDGATHFGRAIARGALQYANLRRAWLTYADLRQDDPELKRWPKCDGAIVAGIGEALIKRVLRRVPHVVNCGTGTDPKIMPVVCGDAAACGKMAAEHLLDCRLRHFGYCGWADNPLSELRLGGFREALREHGCDCSVVNVHSNAFRDTIGFSHRSEIIAWLNGLPKPVGILACDDWVAYDLAATCQAASLVVPDQVAIIGVNNDDLLCQSAWPPLSSVEVDYRQVGYLGSRQLERLLSGERLPAEERLLRIPPMGVVCRQSTDMLAVDDASIAQAVRFIREHACDPCGVDDVLAQVPVGRRWLERKFKEVLDRTPHDELMRVRLEAAQKLLLHTEEKIELIAERCGFSSAGNLGRAFYRVLGITPAAFRRTQRGMRPRGIRLKLATNEHE